MKVIGINPFDKCVQTFDVPVEAAELIPNHLMCSACWLNGTDALYVVEQPIVQQSLQHGRVRRAPTTRARPGRSWRSARSRKCRATLSERKMISKITYTMFIENGDGADEIVAQGVALPRALVLALEHDGRGRATIVHSDIGPFRHFAIGRRPEGDGEFECAAYTVVRRSDSHGSDADRAFEVFEQVLLNRPHEFWSGRVVPDEDYARRHHEENAT